MTGVKWRKHGLIRFEEPDRPESGYTMSDPYCEEMAGTIARTHDAITSTTGDTITISVDDARRLMFAVSCYDHLCTHPMGTERAVLKLRALRRVCK